VHAALDHAHYAAYGWPADISDDALLRELLAENLRRSADPALPVAATGACDGDESEECVHSPFLVFVCYPIPG
jgi:hypothetical protein